MTAITPETDVTTIDVNAKPIAQDPHAAWWAEACRLGEVANEIHSHAPSPKSPENSVLCNAIEARAWRYVEQSLALEDRIAATPAATLDGALVQARVLIAYAAPAGHPSACREAALAHGILASLERIAGTENPAGCQ